MAKFSIKKDDYVMIIAGKDKGKPAQILSIDKKSNRATVEGKGISVKKKAVKARKASDKSGIIEMPITIDVSNLMPICAACNKPTRVGHAEVDGKKVRVCKKCGAVLETKKMVEKKSKTTTAVKKRKKSETAQAEEAVKAVAEAQEVSEPVAPEAPVEE